MNPEIYNDGSSLQFETIQKYLNGIKDDLRFYNAQELVMDIGCGTGKTTLQLLLPILPKDAKVVAVDTKIMTDYARKHNSNPRIIYEVMDIEDENLKDKWQGSSCDKCFSFYVEHWIRNHSMSFSNYFHLLKPGGKLYMFLIDYNNHFGQVDKEISEIPKWKAYSEVLEKNEHTKIKTPDIHKFYQKILMEQKFDLESLHLEIKKAKFENVEQYIDFSKGISYAVPFLPEHLVDSFMEDYMKLALKHGLISIDKTNGQVTLSYFVIFILAVKNESN